MKFEKLEDRVFLTAITEAELFALESRPESNYTIHIDFDGHITEDTFWNTNYSLDQPIHSPAFDTDGNASSFSQNEIDMMYDVWQRVVEDFAPFDVNISLREPDDLEDLQRNYYDENDKWGVRAVVGGRSDWLGGPAGGAAYWGSFNYGNDTPVFIFPKNGLNTSQRIAFATSHEVGHSFRLWHDGHIAPDGTRTEYYRGHGDWAPIMGIGYDKILTQWSDGSYDGGSRTEDDVAIIGGGEYGVTFKPDDHGNTFETSTLLVNGVTGIIEQHSDVDVFGFSLTNEVNVVDVVATHVTDTNLVSLVNVVTDDGTVVGSANNVWEGYDSEATVTTVLPAGEYYATIEGVGYGSLGQYTMTSNSRSVDAADFDLDGTVGVPDLIRWAKNFGTGTTFGEGDSNFDGVVDVSDLIRWAKNFGTAAESEETQTLIFDPIAETWNNGINGWLTENDSKIVDLLKS
jgi:hypothetical protein